MNLLFSAYSYCRSFGSINIYFVQIVSSVHSVKKSCCHHFSVGEITIKVLSKPATMHLDLSLCLMVLKCSMFKKLKLVFTELGRTIGSLLLIS